MKSFLAMLATLRQRNFALLWLGDLISLMGDWALMVGLPIYVFLLTHSVLATSLMLLAESVPSVLLSSLAGVFVDRWNRKYTMVIANLLLAVALLPLLWVRTADHVWIAYVVAAVESCIAQFFRPAESALLPSLVGEEHLVHANGLNSVSSNLARLVGPAVGGVIAGLFGLMGITLVDAVSFLLAGALIAAITASGSVKKPISAGVDVSQSGSMLGRLWGEGRDGLRVIGASRTLTVLLAMLVIMALGEGVMGTLYPVFVYRVLHGQALQIGELMSAQAVGGLLGGLLLGWLGKRLMARLAIGLCSLIFGLIDLVIFNSPAVYPEFWLSVALFVAVGIPAVGMMMGMQSLLQATAPGAYLGRVFGVVGALTGLLGLIGTLTAGFVTDHIGVVTTLNIQGGGYVLAGLLALTLLPRHRPETKPDADTPAVVADTTSLDAREAVATEA
ncbi:MAG: MFS transporter [Ktedonobacterales bacterium]